MSSPATPDAAGSAAARRRPVPPRWAALAALLAWAVPGAAPHAAGAEGYDVLAECMALTDDEDEIHGCLDNYLDVMDDDIGDIEAFLRRELRDEALAGFARSQSAFASYRRENCLWYLEFNSPRRDAEKLAKNCLASMSLDRLAELQSLLVRDEGASRAIDGFYVYGANRNSFRPCGTDARYWVEGEAGSVGAMQQGYAALATAELQVMFASVEGRIDEAGEAPVDHDGVLRVRAVRAVRVPSDGDCRLPDGSPPVTSVAGVDGAASPSVEQRVADVPTRAADADDTDTRDDRAALGVASADGTDGTDGTAADGEGEGDERIGAADDDPTDGWIVYSNGESTPAAPARPNPVADPDGFRVPPPARAEVPVAPDPPTAPSAAPSAATRPATAPAAAAGERLTAYFGAWLADCDADARGRLCRVAVDLGDGAAPRLELLRRGVRDTTVEVVFPDRAIDAASDVDWSIDGYAFGGAGGGELRIGPDGTVLRIADRRFVGEDLLPLMKGGSTLALDVAAGGGRPERLEGTLVGLTRALGFADDFLAGGS